MSAEYVQPGFLMSHVINPIVRSFGGPTLSVNGRRSGMPISTPINPFEFEGATYVIGGGGNTHWVRNLRAAGTGSLRIHGREESFRAVELHGPEQVRIASAYRDRMGRRAASYFAVLPNPADHPVFRVDAAA